MIIKCLIVEHSVCDGNNSNNNENPGSFLFAIPCSRLLAWFSCLRSFIRRLHCFTLFCRSSRSLTPRIYCEAAYISIWVTGTIYFIPFSATRECCLQCSERCLHAFWNLCIKSYANAYDSFLYAFLNCSVFYIYYHQVQSFQSNGIFF